MKLFKEVDYKIYYIHKYIFFDSVKNFTSMIANIIYKYNILIHYYSLYNQEIEKSSKQNQYLGIGIGIFQGLSNMAING